MTTQRKTILDLTVTIANLNQQLQQATVRINNLKITKVTYPLADRPHKWVNGKHIRDAGRYCWTHGYCMDINHNRMECPSNNGGHQDDATSANNKGGNQYNKLSHRGHEKIGETCRTIKRNTCSYNICLTSRDPIADSGATLNYLCMHSTSYYDQQINMIRAQLLNGHKI